jgi:hypothetical protein
MKKFLLTLVMLPSIAFACPNTYGVAFVAQWVHQCTATLYKDPTMSGVPEQFAINMAFFQCSCVIEKFKEVYTQQEVMTMSADDRALFGETFVKQCLGYVPTADTN